MVIATPGGFGPEAETRMPCPACGKGMVSGHVHALVKEALKDEPTPLPQIVTETMGTLPDE